MDQLNCTRSGRQRWAARCRPAAGTVAAQPPPRMAKRSKSPSAVGCCRAVVCPIQAVLESDEFNWRGDNELDQHSYPFSLMLTCSGVPQTPCIKPSNYLGIPKVVTFLCRCYTVQFSLHLPSHSFLQPSLKSLSCKQLGAETLQLSLLS